MLVLDNIPDSMQHMRPYVVSYRTRRQAEVDVVRQYSTHFVGCPVAFRDSVVVRYDAVGNVVVGGPHKTSVHGCYPLEDCGLSLLSLPCKVKGGNAKCVEHVESNNAIHFAAPPDMRGPVLTYGGTLYYDGRNQPPDYPARRGHICKPDDARLLAFKAAMRPRGVAQVTPPQVTAPRAVAAQPVVRPVASPARAAQPVRPQRATPVVSSLPTARPRRMGTPRMPGARQ